MTNELIIAFGIPEAGQDTDIINKMLTPLEQALICSMDPEAIYTQDQMEALLVAVTEAEQAEMTTVKELFRRGVISKGENGIDYCLGSFYGRLDIYATDEVESYDTLTHEQMHALDDWYLEAYLHGLGPEDRPTLDEIVSLQDTLDFIDGRDDTPYLALCDCRRLRQDCNHSTNTCITYRTAPNSFVKRGLIEPITKEQAKEIVRKADKEGLIHTINPGGICCCCTDCCYLFRSAQVRGSLGIWPKVNYRAEMNAQKCIHCRVCMDRCPFSVFSMTASGVRMTATDLCQGCGLCTTTCPTGALKLHEYSH